MKVEIATKDYKFLNFDNVVPGSFKYGEKNLCFITKDELLESAHMIDLEKVNRIQIEQ